ncbi:alpha/beta fold hydrolase [Granulicoccus phenolivorans]|uniref:alpha/beta fold hydrolase n=1 Tax=Granulicoccus phenolivorans TaxID=266854 RepID=UPI00040467DF|nr:alpha/beta fold hydrolase [Granulicoccus phenolivorans]
MDAPLIPPGAEVRGVPTPRGTLAALHAGTPGTSTTPVLLIHGGGSDSSTISWYHLFAPLGPDREVWAIDLPGFGGSIDVPPVGGPEAMADLLAAAAHHLGIGPAVVVGVSMGGDVALQLALDHPGLVRGLVLISPGGLTSRLGGRLAHSAVWTLTLLPDRVLVPLARFANRFAGTAMKSLVSDPATLPAAVVDEFVRLARDPRGSMGYGRYNQATVGRRGMRNDKTPLLHRIGVPTLLFHGQADRAVNPEHSRRAAQRLPDARLVEVPDCGHWGQLDRPDLFLDLLQDFLGEIDGTPAPAPRERSGPAPSAPDTAPHTHVTPGPGESAPFHLTTRWWLAQPAARVWEVFTDVEQWPQWWPGVEEAVILTRGDELGVGTAIALRVHRPVLPDLRLQLTLTRAQPPHRAHAEVTGDLRGHGDWSAVDEAAGCRIELVWCVVTRSRLTRLLRRPSGWAHRRVMDRGLAGLRARLAAGPG